jgi:2-dehydro-3-deoxyphosphooctonate aldolase (KDO 8-P synthase)
MESRTMKLCGFEVGLDRPLFLIAGPCVIESREMALDTAGRLRDICRTLGLNFIYKSSYDKANRSSGKSFRGLGMEQGLDILADVKKQIGVPVLTDVHAEHEVAAVASVVDVLQTPAFLCRQTDFIQACAASGKPVNIKKGQFMAPGDMKQVVLKAREANGGADSIMVCERGASFGYNNLVSDMRSLAIMRETGCPVVFDATHSVQLPGGQGDRSGGQREFVPVLARAAVAVGVAGLFMETHPDPARPCPTGPTPGRCRRWRRCWNNWWSWIRWSSGKEWRHEQAKLAYMVVDARSSDPERMVEYRRLAQVAVAHYGGRYLVRGAPYETLEGNWQPQRLVVLEFPEHGSRAKVLRFSRICRSARRARRRVGFRHAAGEGLLSSTRGNNHECNR